MGSGKFIELHLDTEAMRAFERAAKDYPRIVAEELGKAVQELALIVEAKAKELCPVDTGKLRASITTAIQSWAQAYVGTNTEYAAHVEYGTEAQPFLEPAFLEGEKQAPRVFDAAIKRAMKRLERSLS